MRELARDLPFERVGRIIRREDEACNFEKCSKRQGNLRWLLIQSNTSVRCPWNKRISQSVNPIRVIAFTVDVGPGSEPVNLGLCRYPETIEWIYTPRDDERFESKSKEIPLFGERFDFDKFRRWRNRQKKKDGKFIWSDYKEPRQVKVPGSRGWSWGSFCKTQYASEFGIPNFLRCHISVITLLERIGKLPGINVEINDEGHYGPSNYSDDYQEARAAGREPTYVDHPGQYDPRALAEEVGSWNEMIAGMAGALGDAVKQAGMTMESPIQQFQNFEQLEFRGSQDERLKPFLDAMVGAAKLTQESPNAAPAV